MTRSTLKDSVASCVSDSEFATLLEDIGGFESRPRIGVAVSGGVDSMALLLLCQRWVRSRHGCVLGLTVNHHLRCESTEEVEAVSGWLRARAIDHSVLSWEDVKPTTAILAAARAARYRLLIDACIEHGILHLLLGHQLEDQAETLLQRLAKASGLIGLSAMSSIRELGSLRLIRPLLSISKQRLIATCHVANQRWIEDPSNHSQKFARGRLRRFSHTLGCSSTNLACSARRLGFARAQWETTLAAVLARIVTLYPEGYLHLNLTELLRLATEIVLGVLERCLSVIGRGDYPPRRHKLERLYQALREADDSRTFSRTLAGCRILVPKQEGVCLCVILREWGDITDVRPLRSGQTIWWDERFIISLTAEDTDRSVTVSCFKSQDHVPPPRLIGHARLPRAVVETLPALWSTAGQLIAVAFLTSVSDREDRFLLRYSHFVPRYSLTSSPFAVAPSLDSSYLKNKQ